MKNERSTSSHRRVPKWAVLQNIFEESSREVFPAAGEYRASQWASWERRIRQGQKSEERALHRLARDIESRGSNEFPADVSGIIEDIQQTRRVSATMYGAIFVAFWAEMEHCLNSVLRVGEIAKSTPPKRSHDFQQIKEGIKKLIGTQLTSCRDFKKVDAIRILNNSFKHNGGQYKPQSGKAHTEIDETLLHDWGLEIGKEINFGSLPTGEMAAACNVFLCDLWGKVKLKLREQD